MEERDDDTNIPRGAKGDELRYEAERAKKEKAFLDWLYALRVGEFGRFEPSKGNEPAGSGASGRLPAEYQVYARVPGGWVLETRGTDSIFLPYVKREDA